MTTYELKLATGKVVRWSGQSGEDAATRYVDAHREAKVIAWREDRSPQIRVGA
jgi:hypothetical protein